VLIVYIGGNSTFDYHFPLRNLHTTGKAIPEILSWGCRNLVAPTEIAVALSLLFCCSYYFSYLGLSNAENDKNLQIEFATLVIC